MNLIERVAVVTGANSGLGRASVRHLVHEKKMRVALLDRAFEDPETLEREFGPAAVSLHVADVADSDQVAKAFTEIESRWGSIHACINAAGIAGTMRLMGSKPQADLIETFRRTLAVNLTGSFIVMTNAAHAMVRNEPAPGDGERGVIINISSIAALEGSVGHIAYSASKAGILGMTMPAARELAQHGVRIVSVSPGFFDTPLVGAIKESARERMTSQVLFPGRLGKTEEFVTLISHILENTYINAANLRIDGGIRLN